jgi:hypothetical protein
MDEIEITYALEWALKNLDSSHSLPNETPDHECDYFKNPDKGYCDFCENYWSARKVLDFLKEV